MVYFPYDDPFIWPAFDLPIDIEYLLPKISNLTKSSTEKEWLDCLTSIDGYNFYICHINDDKGSSNDQNVMFPDKCWTFQHHVAFHNAPQSIVIEMLKQKFPVSYKDSHGKLPIDYVDEHATEEYKILFKPRGLHPKTTLSKLNQIEKHMNAIIKDRAGALLKNNGVILPILSVYFENMWYHNKECYTGFPVAGLQCQFNYQSEYSEDGETLEAIAFEIYRYPDYIIGRKYKISENNSTLIEDHFY